MQKMNVVRDTGVISQDPAILVNTPGYKKYAQSRLAKCVKIARMANMSYGAAEQAGLFKDVK